jgi:hypothetical protein
VATTRHMGPIEIDRIFLYEENPRHEPIESEPEIIEHLCKDEQVFNLARNISEAGTNPLQLLGVIELKGEGGKKNYQAWEGNRRVCAIKLLNDPDLAPPDLRKDFAKLAAESEHVPIKKINCVVFDDHDDLRYWMGIIHNGAQGGVGLLDWNAEQKARHFGSSRNRVALAVLDAAERLDLISKDERDGKLTTAQRFLSSTVVREALGLDATNPDDVGVNRPTKDFQKLLGRFIDDLKQGVNVTSRKNKEQIEAYGRKLARTAGVSDERVQPLSLKTAASITGRKKKKTKPKKPRKLLHLEYDKTLAAGIEAIESNKLESLYYSVCDIRVDEHAPLLAVGVWSFVESLTALAGRYADTDFVAFYNNNRMVDLGVDKKKITAVREALTRIQRNGNSTKHHEMAASFDGKQLSNDLATITPLLIKTVESIAAKK